MKKIILPILFLCLLTITGCSKRNDEQTITEAKKVASSYIENNYESVESIKLDEPYRGQMGSLKVDGTVNEIEFSISLNEDLTFKGISIEEKFPERKDECKDTSCEY
ncbi:hypothetical protein [Terribacillus saccharophilus]|uniref:hypothetical protein n=1 Tax=Terribacillus saccharophilus TaxID=361277 RepID=UPI002DC19312|nr:hypothetical protein [Terribacillus saccharophilus]MEC0289899.1 hypothetical protein [Terribacillus saccharophilus]